MNEFEAHEWALREFGGAVFGHSRRTDRAVRIASAMVVNPAASIPEYFSDAAQSKAAYLFLKNDAVSHRGIMSGHVVETARRCAAGRAILSIADTVVVSYSGHETAPDLGPTGDEGARGFFGHTSIAVAADDHEFLGILNQHVWVRPEQRRRRGESTYDRKKRRRESERWQQAIRDVASLIEREHPDSASRPYVIQVADRECDIYDAMEACVDVGHGFVFRAAQNRALDPDDPEDPQFLSDALIDAPLLATTSMHVRPTAKRRERDARLDIRAVPVVLRPPFSRRPRGASMEVNIVSVIERDPPDGEDPICWLLLTSEPIGMSVQLIQIVNHYRARWIIEELHMGMKTGCGVETRQLETAERLENFFAFASVVAWQLVRLRDFARRPDPVPATRVLSEAQLVALVALMPKVTVDCTAAEALRAIAMLGGFMGRKSDGYPGWRTLSRGFEKVLLAERTILGLKRIGRSG